MHKLKRECALLQHDAACYAALARYELGKGNVLHASNAQEKAAYLSHEAMGRLNRILRIKED